MLRYRLKVILLVWVIALAATAVSATAMACSSACSSGKGGERMGFEALSPSHPGCSRENASPPEPMKDPGGACRCIPHHTGKAGGFIPPESFPDLESKGPQPEAWSIVLDRNALFIRPQHPPNISFLKRFLAKSSWLI